MPSGSAEGCRASGALWVQRSLQVKLRSLGTQVKVSKSIAASEQSKSKNSHLLFFVFMGYFCPICRNAQNLFLLYFGGTETLFYRNLSVPS